MKVASPRGEPEKLGVARCVAAFALEVSQVANTQIQLRVDGVDERAFAYAARPGYDRQFVSQQPTQLFEVFRRQGAGLTGGRSNFEPFRSR